MTTESDDDILDAIAQARLAFIKAGIGAPDAIELKTHGDGMRFLSAVRQQRYWTAVAGGPSMGMAVKVGDKDYMQVEVFGGMKVRWPAKFIAGPFGEVVIT